MEPQSGTTTGDRLESWKEIASHLRRDVRTVQRWEQTDALPVHRHERAGRPIPYAYKGELDAWWTNRSADTSLSSVVSHRTVGSAGRRRLVGAVVAGFSLVLLAGVYVIVRGHAAAAHRPSGSSAETGWRVTTQSPSALKLFSEANALGEKDRWGPAEPLLRPSYAAPVLLCLPGRGACSTSPSRRGRSRVSSGPRAENARMRLRLPVRARRRQL